MLVKSKILHSRQEKKMQILTAKLPETHTALYFSGNELQLATTMHYLQDTCKSMVFKNNH